ncbi:lytic transglycosylase [Rhodopseudomonas palustris]|uniref:lytic transglycosylase n=1 Tax=Rhodopseudomonas palustris TaxID=1076 RepID=UPI0005A04858|nr:LysM domain-containing protein [Rhodopseudomonas palustris]
MSTIVIAVAFGATGSAVAQAEANCDRATPVLRGDTLSSIAERCDTTESSLLQANPNIDSSGDLRVGAEIKTTSQTHRTAVRLRSFAHGVSNGLSRLAGEVGSSIDDLLDKNPDLEQRLKSVGDRVTGEAANRSIKLTPAEGSPGASVALTASGLPTDAPVVIGVGLPGQSYSVLERARADADGQLRATLSVPSWASSAQNLVFVVASDDGDWTIRSGKFDVQ